MSNGYINGEKEYKVSVIMPVYNVGKYLKECLESVVNQTLKDIQVICVDDGSSDDSLEILYAFAAYDSRIQVLSARHGGAAKARNLGVEYAIGDYLCFLDSDDIFERDMLEELYTSAVWNDADIAVCEYDADIQKKGQEYLEKVMEKYMGRYARSPFQAVDLPIEGLLFWFPVPWNKLYKKSFLIDQRLSFQDISSANDLYMSYMSMILADRIIHTKSFRPLVHYRRNAQGHISGRRTAKDAYTAVEKVYLDLKARGIMESVYHLYYLPAFFNIITAVLREKGDEIQKKSFYDFFAEKGMRQIGLEREGGEEILLAYRRLVEYFKKNSYESRWYETEKVLSLQLENKGLSEMKVLCSESKVALWGGGARGLAVIEVLEKYGIRMAGVIDQDERKHGNMLAGYVIRSYEQLCDCIDTIIITSKEAFGSICSSIACGNNGNVRILPLFMYLESDFKLKDCLWDQKSLMQGE